MDPTQNLWLRGLLIWNSYFFSIWSKFGFNRVYTISSSFIRFLDQDQLLVRDLVVGQDLVPIQTPLLVEVRSKRRRVGKNANWTKRRLKMNKWVEKWTGNCEANIHDRFSRNLKTLKMLTQKNSKTKKTTTIVLVSARRKLMTGLNRISSTVLELSTIPFQISWFHHWRSWSRFWRWRRWWIWRRCWRDWNCWERSRRVGSNCSGNWEPSSNGHVMGVSTARHIHPLLF